MSSQPRRRDRRARRPRSAGKRMAAAAMRSLLDTSSIRVPEPRGRAATRARPWHAPRQARRWPPISTGGQGPARVL